MVELQVKIISESIEALTGNNLYIDELEFNSTMKTNILDFIKEEFKIGKILEKNNFFPKRKIIEVFIDIK